MLAPLGTIGPTTRRQFRSSLMRSCCARFVRDAAPRVVAVLSGCQWRCSGVVGGDWWRKFGGRWRVFDNQSGQQRLPLTEAWFLLRRDHATGPQKPVGGPRPTTATFPEAVRENEEVVPVNVSTWVLPSGVTVGR